MNILYINHYAGSLDHGMEFRPFHLANQWQALGHTVCIVAADQSHLRQVPIDLDGRSFKREKVHGVDYTWLKTKKYTSNGIKRALNMLSFVRRLYQWRQWLEMTPDVVIASSTYPMDIYPAKKIADKFGAKLVFELHDLWPLSPIELGGMHPGNPFIMLVQHAENYACRHADYVVSMLPCVLEHLIFHGMDRSKFHYIPNGIVADDWGENPVEIPADILKEIERIKRSGKKIVAYAGAHGVANALSAFAEAAMILRDEPVQFVTFGGGPELESLKKATRSCSNFSVFGMIQKGCIPAVLSKMDILFIGLQRQPLFRFGISPNKLMDYMMAAKPIVCAISSGNDIVSDARCGITCEPEDPQSIARAVKILMEGCDEKIAYMGESGRKYVLAHHDYKHLASSFLEILTQKDA